MKMYFIKSYKGDFLYASEDAQTLMKAQGYKDEFGPVESQENLEYCDEVEEIPLSRVRYWSNRKTETEHLVFINEALAKYRVKN